MAFSRWLQTALSGSGFVATASPRSDHWTDYMFLSPFTTATNATSLVGALFVVNV
jgi:hypothetical protein